MKIVSRGDTTVVDAYLSPVLGRYVNQVDFELNAGGAHDTRLMFMQSTGGLTDAKLFQGKDAILSGPAGGVVGMVQTAKVARRFGVKPKVAMLSFSNFGTSGELRTDRIEEAIAIARELDSDLIIDGPMQVDTALVPEIQKDYPFMSFEGPANVLICPNLASANIAYKLLQRIAGAEMTGPILEGLSKPAHVLQRGDSVRDVVHMAAICAVDAQRHAKQRL